MSLVELVVALALASGVALALGHIVTQVTHNVTSIEHRAQRQTEGALALLRLRTELRQATGISDLTARRIAFTHPDVTGDNHADTLTYEWDGVAGSALTRELNAGGPEQLVEQCQSFSVTAKTQLPVTQELLSGHVGYGPGVAAATNEFTITSTNLAAQFFSPSRSGAGSFKVTQVRLYLRPVTVAGSLLVSLHQTLATVPGSSVESVSRPISQIPPGAGWQTFRFSGSNALTAGGTYAVVARCSTAGGSVAVCFDQITQNVPATSGDFYRFSTNGGSTWQPTSGLPAHDLKYMLHGRWLTSGGSLMAISAPYVTGVQVRLETGTSAAPVRFEAAEQCANLPEQVQ